VDRLTFNAPIVETGSESYRLRATHSRKKGVPRPSNPLPATSHRPAHGHTTVGPLLTSKAGPLLVDIPTAGFCRSLRSCHVSLFVISSTIEGYRAFVHQWSR